MVMMVIQCAPDDFKNDGLSAAAVLGLSLAAAPTDAQQRDDAVVARIGDAAVTFTEIEDAWRRNDASSRRRMLQEPCDTRRRRSANRDP